MVEDLIALDGQLRELNPNIVFSTERTSTEDSPFGLRQSYSLKHSNISVNVSIICKTVPDGLKLLSDIVASDSRVLAQFRPLFVSGDLSLKEKQSVIDEWVRELCVFLHASASMIAKCLEQSSTACDTSFVQPR